LKLSNRPMISFSQSSTTIGSNLVTPLLEKYGSSGFLLLRWSSCPVVASPRSRLHHWQNLHICPLDGRSPRRRVHHNIRDRELKVRTDWSLQSVLHTHENHELHSCVQHARYFVRDGITDKQES
jgi:hypothetical protein